MSFNAKELKEKYNPDGSVTYKMQQRMLDLLKVIDAVSTICNIGCRAAPCLVPFAIKVSYLGTTI